MEEKERYSKVTPETFTHPDAPFLPPAVASILVGKHTAHEKWATFLAILVGELQGEGTFRLFVYYSNDTSTPVSVIPMIGISVQTKTLPSGFSFWIFQNDALEPVWKFATKKDTDFQKWIQELARVIETTPGTNPIRSADSQSGSASSNTAANHSPLPSPRILDEPSGSALSRLMPSPKPSATVTSTISALSTSLAVSPASSAIASAPSTTAPPPTVTTGVLVGGTPRGGAPLPHVSPRPMMNQLVMPSTSPLVSPRSLSPAPGQRRPIPTQPPTASSSAIAIAASPQASMSPPRAVASPPISPRPAVAPLSSTPLAISPRGPMAPLAPVAPVAAVSGSPMSALTTAISASPVKAIGSAAVRPISPQKNPVAPISPLRPRPQAGEAGSAPSSPVVGTPASSIRGESNTSSANTSPLNSIAGTAHSSFVVPSKALPTVPKSQAPKSGGGGSGVQPVVGTPGASNKDAASTGLWGVKISPSPKPAAVAAGSAHRNSSDTVAPLAQNASAKQIGSGPALKHSGGSPATSSNTNSLLLSHNLHSSTSSLSALSSTSTPLKTSNSAANKGSSVSTPQATMRGERPKYYHSDYYSNSYLHPEQDTKTRLLHEKDED